MRWLCEPGFGMFFHPDGDAGGAPPATPPANPPAAPPATPPANPPAEKTFTKAEFEQAVKDARAAEAQRLKTEADKKKLADEGEFKTLLETERNEKAELQRQLAARDLADLRRKVAADAKLDPALADRLHGATEAELIEDAKKLAEQFPPADPSGNGGTGNPGGNRSGGGRLNKDQVARLARENPAEFNTRFEKGEFNDVMAGR